MVRIDGREIQRHRVYLSGGKYKERRNSKIIKLHLAGRVRDIKQNALGLGRVRTRGSYRGVMVIPRTGDGTVCLEGKAGKEKSGRE